MAASMNIKQRLRAWDAARRQRRRMRATGEGREDNDYATWVARYDQVDAGVRAAFAQRARQLPLHPLLSVLMPVYNPRPEWLAAAIASVRAQAYEAWELCIADDRSTDPEVVRVLDEAAAADPRIRVLHRPENGHIAAASNSALEMARGEFVVLLDHDDVLPEHALLCIAEVVARQPDVAVVFSDEDKLDADGTRSDPTFKCDFNLDLFRCFNMVSHLGAYRLALVRAVGGFRVGYEGSQDYDLALRCIERVRPEQIVHVPHVLYHWRVHADSTAAGNAVKPYALEAGRRALVEHLQRTGLDATVSTDPSGWYAVEYRLPEPPPKASVIVLDGGDAAELAHCLQVLRQTAWRDVEVLVASAHAAARAQVHARGATPARLCNLAAAQARGALLAFVDASCVPDDPSWLARLGAYALRAGNGLAGAKLVSEQGRIAGGAVLLGLRGRFGLLYKGLDAKEMGYFARAAFPQHITALDAGCVVVARERLEACGGFDAKYRGLQAAVIDLSLRLRRQGLCNTWVPTVRARRRAARGLRKWREERRADRDWPLLRDTWPECSQPDPAYNPNLTIARETFGLAQPPRVAIRERWFEPR